MVVDRNRIGKPVLGLSAQDIGLERIQLVERAARCRGNPVVKDALAPHPAIVRAFVNDVDFLDVGHADIGREHRPVGQIPGQAMRVAETVGVDLTECLRIAVGRELVDGRHRVVPNSLRASRGRGTARIDPQDRGHDRVEPLRLTRIVRVRSAAVAERQIADADVEQAVVGSTRLRRRIEFDVADRMKQAADNVADAQNFAPRTGEGVRRRVGGVPLRDDVMESDIGSRESGWDEIRDRRIPHDAFGVGRVEQSVAGEIRMEVEADESTGQPVVDRERETLRRRWRRPTAGYCRQSDTGSRASRWQTGGRLEDPGHS